MSGSTKLIEMPRRGFANVNGRLGPQSDQIIDVLRRRLGPDHAAFLAEPVGFESTGGASITWFASVDGEARRVTELPVPEADRLRAAADRLMRDVRSLADLLDGEGAASRELARLLRDALVTPDDTFLWSVDGRPVLAGWGFRHASLEAGPKPAEALVGTAAPGGAKTGRPASSTTVDPDIRSPVVAPPADRSALTRRWWDRSIAAWPLLAVVLLLLGDRLLSACAIGSPDWPAALRAILPNRCPAVAANRDALAEVVRADIRMTEAKIRAAELDLVRRAAACTNSCPAVPQPAAMVPIVSSEPARPRIAPEMERRLERVERGRDLELTLAWEGPADLDLLVTCPNGGRIDFQSPNSCGGRLVADLNSGGGSADARPIEHVIWDEAPRPEGSYAVRVSLYNAHGDGRPRIPFRVILSRGGQVIREEAREVSAIRRQDLVLDFTSPLQP